MTDLSKCCKAPVKDALSIQYPNKTAEELRGKTNFLICQKCGEPCDAEPQDQSQQGYALGTKCQRIAECAGKGEPLCAPCAAHVEAVKTAIDKAVDRQSQRGWEERLLKMIEEKHSGLGLCDYMYHNTIAPFIRKVESEAFNRGVEFAKDTIRSSNNP